MIGESGGARGGEEGRESWSQGRGCPAFEQNQMLYDCVSFASIARRGAPSRLAGDLSSAAAAAAATAGADVDGRMPSRLADWLAAPIGSGGTSVLNGVSKGRKG